MSVTIRMGVELDDQFIYDVLTTAVESSIGYWAMCSEINRDVDNHDVLSAVLQDSEYHNDPNPAPGDEPEFKNEELGYDEIIAGIQRIVNGSVEVAAYIRQYILDGVREQDAGCIDSEAADVIAQAGVFNKVVFG